MDEGDKLALELIEFRIEHTRKYPHLPLVFEPKLIARVVNYLCERRLLGETLEQCSKKLGIAEGRLKGWLYRRAPRPPRRPVPDPAAPSLMRSVLVTAEVVRVPDGVPERVYTLCSPMGFRVRGLRLQELIVLLKGLA